MKKTKLTQSTLVIFLIAITSSYTLNAQQVLSQSNSQEITTNLGACAGDSWTPETNSYYRSYIPSDYSFTGDFYVHGANFAYSLVANGGDVPTFNVTVDAYISDAQFPTGTLTLIASKTVNVTVANSQTLVEVLFDTQPLVNATDEIVIKVTGESGETYSVEFHIAGNELGDTSDGFLSAPNCILTEPVPFGILSDTEKMIINLVGDETSTVGITEELTDVISVYPNPATDELIISFDSKINVNSAELYDLAGKDAGIALVNGVMDIKQLPIGIYILNINTSTGVITKKIVKQ